MNMIKIFYKFEINIQISASTNSKIIHEINSINDRYISYSIKVDEQIIDEYEKTD